MSLFRERRVKNSRRNVSISIFFKQGLDVRKLRVVNFEFAGTFVDFMSLQVYIINFNNCIWNIFQQLDKIDKSHQIFFS